MMGLAENFTLRFVLYFVFLSLLSQHFILRIFHRINYIQTVPTLNYMGLPSCFTTTLNRTTIFVTSYSSCFAEEFSPSKMKSTLKERICSLGKFFPLRVDSLSEGGQY